MKKLFFPALFFLLFSCNKKEEEKKFAGFSVEIAKAKEENTWLYTDTIGHVDPIETVDIRSRVEGELESVYFTQGQEVHKDALLLKIDPRPFQAKVDEAQAALEAAKAQLRVAEDKLTRYTPLLKKEYISELDFDDLVNNVDRLRATVEQHYAALQLAKINLSYCYIYSPITGKAGLLQIDKGNLIAPNDQIPIVTIKQITPIYIKFYLPEKELYRVQNYQQKYGHLKLHASFDATFRKYHEGYLEQIDNFVDKDTGMIFLRGIFPNIDKELWPGKYVKVRLYLKESLNTIVVPFTSVQYTIDGTMIYIVEGNVVKRQKVELGQRLDNNIIIKSGVKKEDEIVTQGQLNLFDGAPIQIKQIGIR